MMRKFALLAVCLLTIAACNKKANDDATAWNFGGQSFEGTTAIRADNAIMVRDAGATASIYARFAPGPVTGGAYHVVNGEPKTANEISFSVNRNGEYYISTASGSPTVRVTVVNEKLNILINNVWMMHLPIKRDSLLLDAVMIEQ